MRTSVTSLSKKLISTFFAATLALGLVPASASAVEDSDAEAPKSAESTTVDSLGTEELDQHVISSEGGEASDPLVISSDSEKSALNEQNEAEGLTTSWGEVETTVIPAAMERVNEDVTLTTRTVAQAESTRSFFLAQTLESTRTIPMVSANLPLDTGAGEPVSDNDAVSEIEGGEDSDESDLPTSNTVAADSTVVGAFEYRGMTYAIEPGGESVALMAMDYGKLPRTFIDDKAVVVPAMVTADDIDYYSVTRIAQGAFSSLTKEIAEPDDGAIAPKQIDGEAFDSVISAEASESERSGEVYTEEQFEAYLATLPGIVIVGIPASVTSIENGAFTGADSLRYVVVEEGSAAYSSYDGALYNADLTSLLLIPEGRLGAVRVAPGVTEVAPEAFSHCPSVDTLVADPDSAAYQLLLGNEISKKIRIEAETENDVQTRSFDLGDVLFENDSPEISTLSFENTLSNAAIATTANGRETLYTVSFAYGAYKSAPYTVQTYKRVWDSTGKYTDTFVSSTTRYGTLSQSAYLIWPSGKYILLFTESVDGTDSSGNLTITQTYQKWTWENEWSSSSKWYYNGTALTTGLDLKTVGAGVLSFDNPVVTAQVTYTYSGTTSYTNYTRTSSGDPENASFSDSKGTTGSFTGNKTYTAWLVWAGGQSVDIFTELSGTTQKHVVLAPLKTGYTVTSWKYKNSTFTNGIYMKDVSAGSLVPVWTANTYTVTYNGNGNTGGSTASSSHTYDTAKNLTANGFTKTGYGFAGWAESASGSVKYADKASVKNLSSTAKANVPLYAKWTANTYTVAYNGNGNTGGSTASSTHTYDTAKNLTANGFTRTGYGFAGWAESASGSVKYADKASVKNLATSGTKTLYAKWTANTYTVAYNGNGNTGGSTASSTHTYDVAKNLTANGFTKTGYGFAGWAESASGAVKYANSASVKNLVTNGTKTLYAKWTANTYTVAYNGNGNTGGSTASSTHTYDTAKNLTANGFTKTGYGFAGWAESASGAVKYANQASVTNLATSGTKTLYAKWTANTYTVAYNGNGNTGGSTASSTHTYDTAKNLTANGFTKTGYGFAGWAESASGAVKYANQASVTNLATSGTKTLYAKWTANTYTVAYNGNGNTGGSTASSTHTYDAAKNLTANGFTKTGYGFAGWAESASGAVKYADSASVTNLVTSGTKTLYAKWTANTYTVAYNGNGSTGGSTASSSHTYDTAKNLTTNGFTKTGHTFAGWAESASGAVKYADRASVTNLVTGGTKTLYAKWTANTYNITWKMKDHGTAPSMTTYTYGAAMTLPAPSAVTGWTFGGWFTDENCTSAASITSTTLGDQTFWAKWTVKRHSVSWNYAGAENKTDETVTDVAYGTAVPMRDPGEKPGWNFAGWKATGADTGTYQKTSSYTMKDGNVAFTAVWTKSAYFPVSLQDTDLGAGNGQLWYWPGRGYVTESDSTDVVAPSNKIVDAPSDAQGHFEFVGYFDGQGANATMMIDAQGKLTDDAPELSAGATWHAKWDWVSCKVELDANCASSASQLTNAGTESLDPVTFGESFAVSAGNDLIAPKRKGHTFLGYYTVANPDLRVGQQPQGDQWIAPASDGGMTASANAWDLRSATPGGAYTLYAAWRLDDCAVTLDTSTDAGTEPVAVVGGGNLPSQTWRYAEARPSLPTPSASTFTRNGYVFEGWYRTVGTTEVALSDAQGNPIPAVWNEDGTSALTIHPKWTAKRYELAFDCDYPDVAGLDKNPAPANMANIAYDSAVTLPTASFGAFVFDGWFTESDQELASAHMTSGRFTPKGDLADQTSAPILVHAKWSDPTQRTFTLYAEHPATGDVLLDQTYSYAYGVPVDLTVFSPPRLNGYSFSGWVADDDPIETTVTGFSGLQTTDLRFEAKWLATDLSVTLRTTPDADGTYVMATDALRDRTTPGASTWSETCDSLGADRRSTHIAYTVETDPFMLPDVERTGYDFLGWKRVDAETGALLGDYVEEPIDPREQVKVLDDHALVFAPVFEAATYTIVLDPNGFGLAEQTYPVKYTDEFTFPYPTTIATGSCFTCWSNVRVPYQPALHKKFGQGQSVSLAPGVDGSGAPCAGLAELAQGRTITLYAVWNEAYSVTVPLSANVAIDVESYDMIAGEHTLEPDDQDAGVLYEIESLRYEPAYDANQRVAFEGAADDEVYLSVYAGLPKNLDGRKLLEASNVGADGTLSFGAARTATPLLIPLGGESPRLYTKADLAEVTGNGIGFVPFSAAAANRLTIRYGLHFPNRDDAKKYAYAEDEDRWMLPEADAAGLGGLSGATAEVARLAYTVSMKQATATA